MIVTFTSKNSAKIIMMEKDARVVLNLIGRDYDVVPEHGVITHDQITHAIRSLEVTFHSEEEVEEELEKAEEEVSQEGEEKRDPVLIKQRAWPLFEMLKVAETEGDDILWRAESGY